MTPYQFRIVGKIKPYVRMTQRGKWVNPEAREYIASQTAIGLQVKHQMAQNDWQMLPAKTPLKLEVMAQLPERLYTMDIDNIGKAIQDALQGIVFKNDCWIVEAQYTKKLGEDYTTSILIQTIQ